LVFNFGWKMCQGILTISAATEAMRHFFKLRAHNYQFAGAEDFNNLVSFTPNCVEYDLIRKFSDEFCCFDSEAFSYTDELYKMFCRVFGNRVFQDITGFSQAFYRANQNRVEKIRKHTNQMNAWGFRGVTMKG
ncbi:MAG: hypothetical protein ACI4J2_09530, partial [Ruminococcus sp.]